MKICVYGAGAVGGLIAAWLARSGEDVSVVARGAALDAIRAGGLRVRSGGKIETFAVRADSAPAKLGAQDYVVVAVKAQSLAEVASRIAPLVGAGTSIITAMNGVPWWFFDRLRFGEGSQRLESLDPGGGLSRAMPTERLVGCVIHLAASTRSVGMARESLPPGSSDSSRLSRPWRPWKNHHGTPFIAVTTEVSRPSNGAIESATSVRFCALTVTKT